MGQAYRYLHIGEGQLSGLNVCEWDRRRYLGEGQLSWWVVAQWVKYSKVD